MYYLQKLYRSLKIYLLYGEIDVLEGSNSGYFYSNSKTEIILNKCLEFRTILEQYKNDFNDNGFSLFEFVNEESISICIKQLTKNNT